MLQHMSRVDQGDRPVRDERQVFDRAAMIDVFEIERIHMKPTGNMLHPATEMQLLDIRSTNALMSP